MWSSCHTRLALTKFGGLFSRLTFHVHPLLSDDYTLRFYCSRTLLLNEVESLPPLIFQSEFIQAASFCWPGRRYCCCCCSYKRTSNTLKSVFSFRLLSPSGLWPWTEKSSSLRTRRPHFNEIEISTRLPFPVRANIGVKFQIVTLRRRIWILSPFLLLVALVRKFSWDISIHPERPVKSHTSASSESLLISIKFISASLYLGLCNRWPRTYSLDVISCFDFFFFSTSKLF
jgi:hypothetical protein